MYGTRPKEKIPNTMPMYLAWIGVVWPYPRTASASGGPSTSSSSEAGTTITDDSRTSPGEVALDRRGTCVRPRARSSWAAGQ